MKAKIKNISKVLKEVHKQFLEQERILAEDYFQKKIAPFEFLMILTQDKNFAWLKPFSALIAEIDAFSDNSNEISNADLICIKDQIDFLINHPSSSIYERYKYHLANDAAFILFHSSLKKELDLFIKS